jgi:hypothetical protein
MEKKENNTVTETIVTAAKEAAGGIQEAIQKADDFIDAASPHAERVVKAVGTGASRLGDALAKSAKSALRQIDKATEQHRKSKTGYYEILMVNSPNERTFTLDGKLLYSTQTNMIGKEVFYDWDDNEIGYVTCKKASLLKRCSAEVFLFRRDGGMITPSGKAPYKFQYKNCFIRVGKQDNVSVECEKEILAYTAVRKQGGRIIYIRNPEFGDEMIMTIAAVLKCINS